MRLLPRAMASVASSVLALVAGLTSANAHGPHWRIAAATGRTILMGLSANRDGVVWAAGFRCTRLGPCSDRQVRVEYFDAEEWHTVASPTGLPSQSVRVTVGVGSSRNAWLFASNLRTAKAFHWNGWAWTGHTMAGASAIGSVDVFGPRSAWAFGLAGQKGYVARFNGRSWNPVSAPGTVYYQQALSPRDIWAVGPSAATQSRPPAKQVYLAMRWNGHAWRSLPLPSLHLRGGAYLAVYGLAALGPRNLWLDYSTAGSGHQGAALLHWNGAWHTVRVPYSAATAAVQRMVPDGDGGLWIAAIGNSPRFTQYFYHYRRGRWSRQPAPAALHMTSSVHDLSWIPGTRSVWAAADTEPASGRGPRVGILLRYGN